VASKPIDTMNTKMQVALAWIFMSVMFGITAFTLYADYQRDIRQGRIMQY
jgi:hypothetical protein